MLTVVFLLSVSGFLVACRAREYEGKEIAKLTYETIDYNGGFTRERILDFSDNVFYVIEYFPSETEKPLSSVRKRFDDAAEKTFINGVYACGLLDLKEKYENGSIVSDGGSWKLRFDYADGSQKISSGNNAEPKKVFDACATYFFDLCGEPILGKLPPFYAEPPDVSYSFYYKTANGSVSDNGLAEVVRADFQWNKSKKQGSDLYALNRDSVSEFAEDIDYFLSLYTANYSCNKKFNEITVWQYDFDETPSERTKVYGGGWFSQIEIRLLRDKIYLYELKFENGDFVQYTFHT